MQKDYKKKAFTLVELIVGVTISMILMMSVGIFVNSGIQNILNQQKSLSNTDSFTDFITLLNTSFDLSNSKIFTPQITSSGIIIKRQIHFGDGGFSYIGKTDLNDETYCLSGSENMNTNHIFVKNFIPFEEQGEDIFNNFEKTLTGVVNIGGDKYISIYKNHTVLKNGQVVIGKGVFGNRFIDGKYGTGVYLNSPTGLTNSGNILFLSDTLNNRVLYYNISTKKIFKLLDGKDGLDEPTGLYYDNLNKDLYISNSGKGEILVFSSKSGDKKLNIDFKLDKNINNLKKIKIEFFTGVTDINNLVNNNTDKPNFDFLGINKQIDYLTGNTNLVEYYFSNFFTTLSIDGPKTIIGCSTNTDYSIQGTNVIKVNTSCISTNTGTLTKYIGDSFQNLSSGSLVSIKTNVDIIGTDFSNTGSYYVKLSLYGGSDMYSDYFTFFTKSDDNILTKSDNILKTHKSGLDYPTGIWGTGDFDFNQFGIGGFDNLKFDKTQDFVLKTPIKDLDIDFTNDLVSFILKYYKKYNCYNLDDKIERTFILKKSFK